MNIVISIYTLYASRHITTYIKLGNLMERFEILGVPMAITGICMACSNGLFLLLLTAVNFIVDGRRQSC